MSDLSEGVPSGLRGHGTAALWVSELTERQLPLVCAWTGEPAQFFQPRRFSVTLSRRSKGLVGLALVVAGVLGATLALVGQDLKGYLPMSRAGRRAEAAWGCAMLIAALVVPLCIALAFWQGGSGNDGAASLLILGAGLALLVMVALMVIRRLQSPRGRVRPGVDGGEPWVLLKGVHPNFARAIRELPRIRPDRAMQTYEQPRR